MTALVPFNRKGNALVRAGAGFEDFYNILDDFFNGGFMTGRKLTRDSFKIDIEETDAAYAIEAEMPGVSKEEIELKIEDENLCIAVNRAEEEKKEEKNFIHRERRVCSMRRRVRLAGAKMDEIKAKLDGGVLTVTVPKTIRDNEPKKIEIA